MTKESYIGLRTTGRTVEAQNPSLGDMLIIAESWNFPKMAGRRRVGATENLGEMNKALYFKDQCVFYVLYTESGFVGQPDHFGCWRCVWKHP